jgi:hypothetical protein
MEGDISFTLNSMMITKLICTFFPGALQSLKDLGRFTYRIFLELFRHMVGLLGRVISPSQGLYLHRTTQHKDADKHPCLERDSNPRSQQPTGQDPRLRPHGHCDRQYVHICEYISRTSCQKGVSTYLHNWIYFV